MMAARDRPESPIKPQDERKVEKATPEPTVRPSSSPITSPDSTLPPPSETRQDVSNLRTTAKHTETRSPARVVKGEARERDASTETSRSVVGAAPEASKNDLADFVVKKKEEESEPGVKNDEDDGIGGSKKRKHDEDGDGKTRDAQEQHEIKVEENASPEKAEDESHSRDAHTSLGEPRESQPSSKKPRVAAPGKGDEQTRKRGARVFGFLLGTLNKAKRTSQLQADKEKKREEIQKTVRTKIIKEKEEIVKSMELERKRSRERKVLNAKIAQRRRERDLQKFKIKQQQNCLELLKTKTQPVVYYLPKVLTEEMKRVVRENKERFNKEKVEVEEKIRSLNNEIEELEGMVPRLDEAVTKSLKVDLDSDRIDCYVKTEIPGTDGRPKSSEKIVDADSGVKELETDKVPPPTSRSPLAHDDEPKPDVLDIPTEPASRDGSWSASASGENPIQKKEENLVEKNSMASRETKNPDSAPNAGAEREEQPQAATGESLRKTDPVESEVDAGNAVVETCKEDASKVKKKADVDSVAPKHSSSPDVSTVSSASSLSPTLSSLSSASFASTDGNGDVAKEGPKASPTQSPTPSSSSKIPPKRARPEEAAEDGRDAKQIKHDVDGGKSIGKGSTG